jgi:hypothetical protein
MRILKLSYLDKESGWHIPEITLDVFNLLVGASGVGKTRILQSLLTIKEIAFGKVQPGVEWSIEFQSGGCLYTWKGEYDTARDTQTDADSIVKRPHKADVGNVTLLNEELTKEGAVLASRKGPRVVFKGQKLPVMLSPSESLLSLIEDEQILTIREAFKSIFEATTDPRSRYSMIVPVIKNRYSDIESIRSGDFDVLTRLALAFFNAPEIFQLVKEELSVLFPRLEDLKISLISHSDLRIKVGDLPQTQATDIIVSFKEHGTPWLSHTDMSSGMWKTLLLISEIYLCNNGSVILIDEVENSLGVNCIELIGDLVNSDRDIQYIVTSHHPYIINNIPVSKWKIVTRSGSVVQARPATDFNLGNSKHEAFMQLIQLDAYRKGEVEA